jgi:hypothetical protein
VFSEQSGGAWNEGKLYKGSTSTFGVARYEYALYGIAEDLYRAWIAISIRLEAKPVCENGIGSWTELNRVDLRIADEQIPHVVFNSSLLSGCS